MRSLLRWPSDERLPPLARGAVGPKGAQLLTLRSPSYETARGVSRTEIHIAPEMIRNRGLIFPAGIHRARLGTSCILGSQAPRALLFLPATWAIQRYIHRSQQSSEIGSALKLSSRTGSGGGAFCESELSPVAVIKKPFRCL